MTLIDEQPRLAAAPAATGGGALATTSAPAPATPFTARQRIALLAIALVGAALRLLDLGSWSLWVDEAHTWRDATLPLGEFLGSARGWYPTSYLLLRWLLDAGWVDGGSEWGLRLPFALAGIATVPLLASVGRPLVGARAALLAALLLAIDPWHVYWSQNARAYVLVVLFAVLACGAFWRGIASRRGGWIALGVGLAAVGVSCHATGLVLLPVFLCWPLLASRLLAGRRLVLLAAIAGVGMVLLPLVLEQFPPLRIFLQARPETGPSLIHLLQTTAFWFRLPLLAAAVVGAVLLAAPRLHGRALFLVLWAGLPLVLLGLVGSLAAKVTARYAVGALPAVVLLAAAAAVHIGEALASSSAGGGRPGRRLRLLSAAALPAVLCLDLLVYDGLYFTVQHGDRGRWREASAALRDLGGDRPFTALTTHEPVLQYYLRPDHYRGAAGAVDDPGRPQVVSIEDYEIRREVDGRRWLRSARAAATAAGRALLVAAALPELAEKDVDGSLRAALVDQCELVAVLPCQVGPKDETIWIWRSRE